MEKEKLDQKWDRRVRTILRDESKGCNDVTDVEGTVKMRRM